MWYYYEIVLILENITNKIVVFIEFREVIVATSMNANKGYLARIELLQSLTVPDRDEPVFCAMYNISMTINMADPSIRTKMIT